jgi:2'-5' RNA ligase
MELQALHRELERRLAALGFEIERRRFSPHLTVARVREHGDGRVRRLRDALAGLDVRPVGWSVGRVALIQSDLSGPRPRYTTIAHLDLAAEVP